MRSVYLSITGLLLVTTLSFGQTITSVQDGLWSDTNTWSTGVVPNSSNSSSIVIQHLINVDISVTIDETFVDIGGSLIINSGISVIVADGTGNDLDVFNDGIDYGLLDVNGTLICNNGALITGTDQGNANFNSGGIYRHLYTTTQGSIPVANWNTNSMVQIQGYTSGFTAMPAGNWSQSFYDFQFNCSSLGSGIVQFEGLLQNVVNDLTIVNTGTTGSFRFAQGQNPTISIGRDLTISNSSRVIFNTTGNSTIYNIGRDFIYNSTNSSGAILNSAGSTTINVTRNFSMAASGGQLNFSSGAGTGTINVLGDFALVAGTITETSSGTGSINFTGAGVHTYSNSGSVANTINYSVSSLSTLNLGTSALIGGGNLTLNGTIGLGSIDASGALQTGTSGGNIRVSGTRTYSSGSTIVYNGLSGQFIGNGFPSGGDVNLVINNSSNVTLSTSLDIVALRTLTLTSGNIVIGTQTLTINGTVTGSGGIVGGPLSNLVIGGTGAFGTLNFSGTNQLFNFTMNRNGSVNLGGSLTILGTLTHTEGSLDLGSNTLTISGNYSRNLGTIGVTSASSVVIKWFWNPSYWKCRLIRICTWYIDLKSIRCYIKCKCYSGCNKSEFIFRNFK